MTVSTQIKLSPAMVTALKGAEIREGRVFVPDTTKAQTVKGLEARGLMGEGTNELNADGVEAARQLGAVLSSDSLTDDVQVQQQDKEIQALEELLTGDSWGTDVKPENITPEMIDQAAQNLLKAVDLDKPYVVPNREDKRKVRFSLRGALARLAERKRVRQVKKYGSAKLSTLPVPEKV